MNTQSPGDGQSRRKKPLVVVTTRLRTDDYYYLKRVSRQRGDPYQALLREAVREWCDRDRGRKRANVL